MKDFFKWIIEILNSIFENFPSWIDPFFITNLLFDFIDNIVLFFGIVYFWCRFIVDILIWDLFKAIIEMCEEGVFIFKNYINSYFIENDEEKNSSSKTIEADNNVNDQADTRLLDSELNESSASPLEGFIIFNDYTNFKFTSQLFFNIFLDFFIILLFIIPILILFQNKFINISVYLFDVFKFFFNLFKNIILSVRLERFFFFLLSIFTVIIFFNFGGFSLHELSFTSHAFVTLFLSFIIFFNIFFNIIVNFNSFFYKKFVQENLNVLLTVLLFVIEIISFFIRPLSLGIRLFTNILAGHILIHIFFGFFLFLYNIIFWFSFLVFIFCNLILALEVFVAIIQSYIFFVLSVVYLKDAYVLHG